MKLFNKKDFHNDLLKFIDEQTDVHGTLSNNPEFKQKLNDYLKSKLFHDQIAETRHFSIMLTDLRGFTSMAEKLPPFHVIELLNQYYSRMSEIIDRHGGMIDKFMGDSIMVLFATDSDDDSDLIATLRCAIEMQIAMNEINELSANMGLPNLYMGIGINTGEVVAGTLGSDIHREFTVIGDEVNLASRLEAQSLRGQILLSDNTYLLAKDYIEVGTMNSVHVKGKREAVKMFELLSVSVPDYLAVPQREIRTSPRVEVNFPLHFHVLDGKRVLDTEYTGTVIDISYGGLFIFTPAPLEPQSEIKMALSLSILVKGSSEIYARVIHCKEVPGGYESNVEFTSLDDLARATVKSYVDRLI